MTNKAVSIVHEELGKAQVFESSLKVWLARGWKLDDAGAGVDDGPSADESENPPAPAPQSSELDLGDNAPDPTQT